MTRTDLILTTWQGDQIAQRAMLEGMLIENSTCRLNNWAPTHSEADFASFRDKVIANNTKRMEEISAAMQGGN